MSYCVRLLDKKNTDQFKKEQTKKVYDYLYNKVFSKDLNFSIDSHHVKETFKALDKVYFDNKLSSTLKETASTLKFSATGKLTKSAGMCISNYWLDDYGDLDHGEFKIEISKPIINGMFKDGITKCSKINGLY